MYELYSATICPFAQRVRALLVHLGQPFEVHEIDLGNRNPEFLRISPTGKVPLLRAGDLKLYESQVINEYLAERHGWERGLAADAGLRARQRLAMTQWDAVVLSAFYRSLQEAGEIDATRKAAVERELDELARTVSRMQGEPENLLGFHCAPFWVRMDWLRAHSRLPELIERQAPLRAWLEGAAALPAVRETLPERVSTVRHYEEQYVGRAKIRGTSAARAPE